MGHRVHDKAQELSGGLHRGDPYVRIQHAVQVQARARICQEANEILDKFDNVGKGTEQEMSW